MVHTVILYLYRKIFYKLVLCILNKILNVLFTMEIIFFFSKFRSYRILDFMQKILLKIYFIDNNENFVRKSTILRPQSENIRTPSQDPPIGMPAHALSVPVVGPLGVPKGLF